MPSVPSPTLTPARCSAPTGHTPVPSFMLLVGLCDTLVRDEASSRISSSVSQLQCARMVRGPRIPARAR